MEPWGIAVICLIIIIFFYASFCLICVAIANEKLFGVRGEDPHNPIYLRYEDYEDWMERKPYMCGYYGKAINGYIYSDKNFKDYKGFIILSHGFFGTHVQYLFDIAMLAKKGYQVLAYDQFGVGISEGRSQQALATGIYVLENVIADVEKKDINHGLNLYLYGHSWGGYCVVGAMRNHPEIKGVIARSAPMGPGIAGKDLMKTFAPKLYPFISQLIRFSSFLILGFRYSIKAKRGFKNKTSPVLLIQAKNDPMVPYCHSLAKYCEDHKKENVQISVTDKGLHNSLLVEEDQNQYRTWVKEYKEIEKIADEKEKTRMEEKFIASLDRVHSYHYDEDVSKEIIDFLEETKK